MTLDPRDAVVKTLHRTTSAPCFSRRGRSLRPQVSDRGRALLASIWTSMSGIGHDSRTRESCRWWMYKCTQNRGVPSHFATIVTAEPHGRRRREKNSALFHMVYTFCFTDLSNTSCTRGFGHARPCLNFITRFVDAMDSARRSC